MADPIDFSSIGGQPVQPKTIDFSSVGGRPVAQAAPSTVTGNVATFKAAPQPWTVPWLKEKLYNMADSLTEGIPAAGATGGAIIGGTAGSAAPGPGTALGAIGGAGIGGMGGEALKQLVRRGLGFEVPNTSEEAANEITKQGVIQGGIQAGSELLPALAPMLRNAAVSQYTKGLKPTTAENKVIAQDVVPQLIQRGVHGSTQDIEGQAADQIAKLRPQVNQAYANVSQGSVSSQSPISTTLSSLEKMKNKYVVDGEVVNPHAVNAIEGVQQIVEKYGNNISPQSLRRIKQIFDESVSEAGGYTNADLTTNYTLKAQREAANQIRDVLHTADPTTAAVDKEISFWLDVQQVAKATNIRTAGQEGGLLKTFTPLAAAGAGAAGLPFGAEASMGAAATTALAGYVAQAVKTPAWRTASAVMKDQLANALASGNTKLAAAMISRFGVAVPVSAIYGQQPNRSAPAPGQ